MAIGRSRNEAADPATNFNTGIPYPQSPNYYLSEFHLTERQSRFSALVHGPYDPNVALEGYLDFDFVGAPSNANNNESSGFSPRVRHLFADYLRKDQGWYLEFGQTWSLATQNTQGIGLRAANAPIAAEATPLPGFTWTRVPQIRFVKNFGNAAAFGVSVENPAVLVSAATTAPASWQTANGYAPFYSTQGGSSSYAGQITTNQLPDIVAKLTL